MNHLLDVHLISPSALGHLDYVEIAIRDDGLDHTPWQPPMMGSSAAENPTEDVIYGPFTFRPRTDGHGGPEGYRIREFPLEVGGWMPLGMEPSNPPLAATRAGGGEFWRKRYEGGRVRMTLTCYRDGFRPWIIHAEVDPAFGERQDGSLKRSTIPTKVITLSAEGIEAATR